MFASANPTASLPAAVISQGMEMEIADGRRKAANPVGNTSFRDHFNRLVEENQDAAYRLAYYLMDNEADAEDLTQMAFMSAYQNYHTFRGESFRAWLLKIIRNAGYDELRRIKRHRWLALDCLEGGEEICYGPRRLPENPSRHLEKVVEQRERVQQIENAIKELPEKYRTVLVLVDLQELDYQEAAEVIQKPVGTVKSRLARARLSLRKLIEDSKIKLKSR